MKRTPWVPDYPGTDTRLEGGFGVYAPNPWGPWTTVFFREEINQ